MAEVASRKSWHQLFRGCLQIPLGLHNTTWHDTYFPIPWPNNPLIAVGAVTDSKDLKALIQMLVNKGNHVDPTSGEMKQVLSEHAVQQMFQRQNLGDTTNDSIFNQNGTLLTAAVDWEKANLLSTDEADCERFVESCRVWSWCMAWYPSPVTHQW